MDCCASCMEASQAQAQANVSLAKSAMDLQANAVAALVNGSTAAQSSEATAMVNSAMAEAGIGTKLNITA